MFILLSPDIGGRLVSVTVVVLVLVVVGSMTVVVVVVVSVIPPDVVTGVAISLVWINELDGWDGLAELLLLLLILSNKALIPKGSD